MALVSTTPIVLDDATREGEWIYQQKTTNRDAVDFSLTNLEPCTEYEVEVSLDPEFPSYQGVIFKTQCDGN